MQNSITNQKKATRLSVVKTYASDIQGEEVKLVMYRKGSSYGVVTLRHNTATAKDYQEDEKKSLSTFVGNESSVIDWVNLNEANTRYNTLLMDLIGKTRRASTFGAPHLRVVA